MKLISCAFPKTENLEFAYMCFCVVLIHSISFIFTTVHRMMVLFDRISEQIDNILSDYPSATIHICVDFHIHHNEWLVHSNITYEEGKYWHDFTITYELTQIMHMLTRFPNIAGQYAKFLEHFLTSCTDQCSVEVLPPTLDTSNRSLVSQN